MKKILVPVVAIVALAGIELYALSQGINGTLMTVTMAGITGIAGYNLKNMKPCDPK